MKQLLTVLLTALFAVASVNAVAADEKKEGTTTEMKKDAQDGKAKKTTTAKKTTKKKKKSASTQKPAATDKPAPKEQK